ncbi:MAG: Fe-S cluster assembly protein SufD [Mucilaginibacter polytrichastri]|nr:Fe-S cluster assembly protein SufD [Mucilaginibacter polytrichastri]
MITEKAKQSAAGDLREALNGVAQSRHAALEEIRRNAVADFERLGFPSTRDEEWKYTRVATLFNEPLSPGIHHTDASHIKIQGENSLPGHENANVLVFINGVFTPDFSVIRSAGLNVLPLDEAYAQPEFRPVIAQNFGHAAGYVKDGIYALNTAFLSEGVFISSANNAVIEEPVYLYHIRGAETATLACPRLFIHVGERSEITFAEHYFGTSAATQVVNQVTEIIVEKDAHLEFYRLQNEGDQISQINTTHIRQIGKSVVNTVTISLGGKMVRNNLHAVLEAEHAEAHLYGLYFLKDKNQVDNHTIVDNVVPNCLSNELYKGVLDDLSAGVFNGKVYVRKDAQKTNAFQSNKNILLSDSATVNTKPQLEIFADDVKCSHGCTVGSLDPEGLFYLQSRGIPYDSAVALLLQGFAMDVLDKIRHEPIREYARALIVKQLTKERV